MPAEVFGMLFVMHRGVPSAVRSGGATQKGGGPRPPQNFKKLIYSMYIIYILKNVVCKT